MSPAAANPKLLLVATPSATSSEPGLASVRRYRLARLRFDGPSGASDTGASTAPSRSDQLRRRLAQ